MVAGLPGRRECGGVTEPGDTSPEAAATPGANEAATAPGEGHAREDDHAPEDGPPALLTEPFDVPFPAAGIVRAVRRRADASQRELARFARVHPTTVGRIEAGTLVPSVAMLSRILGVAGFRLVVVDEAGTVLKPMRDRADLRDGAERRYPSHLDVVTDPEPGSGGPTSTGWPGRRRRSTGTAPSGTRCGGAASGRCGWPSTGTCRPHPTRSGADTAAARRPAGEPDDGPPRGTPLSRRSGSSRRRPGR